MLTIKFKKIGKKHQTSFRVVVIEKRTKLYGRPVEDLGYIDPKSKKLVFNKERALYWISKGAQPTPTVHNLLVKTGALKGKKKIAVHKKSKKVEEKKEEVKPAVKPAEPAAVPATE